MTLKLCAVFAAICLLLLFPALAHAGTQQQIVLGHRLTLYWAPPNAGQGSKQPLLLFSNGFQDCASQAVHLTEALAEAGYWVFAPVHDDANCDASKAPRNAEKEFGNPKAWDDTTYTDRADDMRDLLDALQHDPQFKNRIDFSRLGLIGHSLGGYTALGLAGAWPSWKMPGIKAVLALSPYSQPFNEKHTLANVKVPVMYQTGTRDGNANDLKKKDGSYDQTTAPKYLVELDRATHLAWVRPNSRYHASTIAYSIAFLDHYVKGLPATPALIAVRGDVAEIKYDSDLGKGDSAPSAENSN